MPSNAICIELINEIFKLEGKQLIISAEPYKYSIKRDID